MLSTVKRDLEGFIRNPISGQSDIIGWILFLGFALVVLLAWWRVIQYVKKEV